MEGKNGEINVVIYQCINRQKCDDTGSLENEDGDSATWKRISESNGKSYFLHAFFRLKSLESDDEHGDSLHKLCDRFR